MRTLALLLLACPLLAAEPQTLPAKVARWPGEGQRPCEVQRPAGIREATTTPVSTNPPGYDVLYAATQQTHRPLVCWVGMKPRQIAGTYSLACLEFPDAVAPCVVVGTWERGKFVRYDLAASASDVEIIVRANAEVSVPAPVVRYAPPPTYIYPTYAPYRSTQDCPT